eukprot:TRINITY_DN4263_c0_g1_i1.p2 TRINITY_DN4263_c0_g1~~TRINITY_DN4263_c0_g1_i1.p2  ORF type:complete len:169 (-),score=25.10 TRINITY_DN4263_c0_g1_i1:35-541(-)
MDYYTDWGSTTPSDDLFVNRIETIWGVNEYDRCTPTKEEVKAIIKNLRSKIIIKTAGAKDETILRRIFNEYDTERVGYLNPDQFNSLLIRMELPVISKYLGAVFAFLDKNKTGFIEFEEFVSYVLYDPFPQSSQSISSVRLHSFLKHSFFHVSQACLLYTSPSPRDQA